MGPGSGGGAGLSRSNRQNPCRDRRLDNREQKRIGDRVEELAKALKAKDVMVEDMKKEKVETEQVLEKMKQTIATMQGTVSNSRDHQTEMSRIQKEFLLAAKFSFCQSPASKCAAPTLKTKGVTASTSRQAPAPWHSPS